MIKHKEIVLVRVLGDNRKSIISEVSEMLSELNDSESKISLELYCSMTLPTDFSVHLDYYDSVKRNAPCPFGQHLAEALKMFGLISHSVWTIEKKRPAEGKSPNRWGEDR